jgi:Tol biopolymer transport system component
MIRPHRTAFAGLLAAVLATGTAPAAGAEAAPDGTLVFTSYGVPELNPAGDYDIFTMNADGSNLVNLTETPEDTSDGPQDTSPKWSPDGSRILFLSTAIEEDAELWVMDRDGANRQQLTDNASPDFGGTWSPDGARVAWSVDDQEHFDFDIWVMDADGSNQAPVTAEAPEELQFNEWQPDWAPNGRIVYSATTLVPFLDDEGAFYKIFSMEPDGSDRVMLSEGPDPSDDVPNHDEQPAVSPDGAWIAFGSNKQPEQDWDVVVIRTSDGAQFNLTNTYPESELFPMWSPDGTKLLFVSSVSEDLYSIDVADFPTGPAPAGTEAAGGLPYERFTSVGGIESADWRARGAACTRSGTAGPDVLRGTSARDVLCGLGGDDVIRGFGGADVLRGGAGRDVLEGGDGRDVLRGETSSDRLSGGHEADRLFGGRGNDELFGGRGPDTCVQGSGVGPRSSCEA